MTLSLKRRLMFKVLSFLNHSAEKRRDLKVCPYSLTFGYNAQGKLGVVSIRWEKHHNNNTNVTS